MITITNILVATDFVMPPGSGVDLDQLQREMEQEAAKRLTELTEPDAASLTIRTAVQVSSASARTILGYARDEHIDLIVLIVIGTQGRTGLAHFFLGSVAQHVVQSAPCPVLTVHHPEREFVHPDALQVMGRYEPVAPR